MDVDVPDSDVYLKWIEGCETCFSMLTLIKSDGLGGTRGGTAYSLLGKGLLYHMSLEVEGVAPSLHN